MNQPVLRFFRGLFGFFMALSLIALVVPVFFTMIDIFVIDIPFFQLDLLSRIFFGGLMGYFVFGGIYLAFDFEIDLDEPLDYGIGFYV